MLSLFITAAMTSLFGAPAIAAQPADVTTASAQMEQDKPGFSERNGLKWIPLRLEVGGDLYLQNTPTVYLGAGLHLLSIRQVMLEANVQTTVVASVLEQTNVYRRHVAHTYATADALWPMSQRLAVGPFAGINHRSFRQNDGQTWNQIVANNVVPVLGARGQFLFVNTKRWGLGVNVRLQTDLGQTKLYANDGSAMTFSPVSAHTGLRVVLGSGKTATTFNQPGVSP